MGIQTTIEDFNDRDLSILRIGGEMDFDVRADFIKALAALLAKPRTKIAVDLSRVLRMSSVFIGTLIDFGGQAKKANRQFSIVMVEKLAGVCREAGLDKVVSIVIAKPQG